MAVMLMPHLDSHARVLLFICFSLILVILSIAHSKSEVLLQTRFRHKRVQKTLNGVTAANAELLRDVSNSTLGASLYSCRQSWPLADEAAVPKNIRNWPAIAD
jgi:hypothetical protein